MSNEPTTQDNEVVIEAAEPKAVVIEAPEAQAAPAAPKAADKARAAATNAVAGGKKLAAQTGAKTREFSAQASAKAAQLRADFTKEGGGKDKIVAAAQTAKVKTAAAGASIADATSKAGIKVNAAIDKAVHSETTKKVVTGVQSASAKTGEAARKVQADVSARYSTLSTKWAAMKAEAAERNEAVERSQNHGLSNEEHLDMIAEKRLEIAAERYTGPSQG